MTTRALLSDESCKEILQNFLQTLNVIKYVSSELKPISEDLEGFVGEHVKLIINYETEGIIKSQGFFVKTKPSKYKLQIDMAEGLGAYKKEIFAYETLFKEFKKYGYDTSFASDLYYSVPNETLVLEDVTLKGFNISDKNTNFSEDHVKCALKSLAMFHAAGFALERRRSKELNREVILGEEYKEYFSENFFVQYIDQNMFAMKWWNSFPKVLDGIIDLLPQNDAYKQEFKKLIKEAKAGEAFAIEAKSNINKTCGHGDLWSNNLLFKYKNNIPVGCCLVDYQFIRYCYPSMDVLLVIFTNTSLQFRRLHLEDLYRYYHKTLADNLKRYGYDIEEIYPLEDFYDSINLVEVEATMQYFLNVSIVRLPKINVNDFDESDSGFNEVLFNNDKLAAKAFQNDVWYRNSLCDAAYALRDALVKRCQK